jgi:ketosteroid isomerase-like protein
VEGQEIVVPEEEVIVAGDIAIHRYSGIATLTPKMGGEPVIADRKFMDVLRRESDGQWRVARHMFNLNR